MQAALYFTGPELRFCGPCRPCSSSMMAIKEVFGTLGVRMYSASKVTVCVPAALKLTLPSAEPLFLTAPARNSYHTVPGPSVVISPSKRSRLGHGPA